MQLQKRLEDTGGNHVQIQQQEAEEVIRSNHRLLHGEISPEQKAIFIHEGPFVPTKAPAAFSRSDFFHPLPHDHLDSLAKEEWTMRLSSLSARG